MSADCFVCMQVISKGAILFGDTVLEPSPVIGHQLELTFSEVMAHMMLPSARIVAWTVTSAGEIISDSLQITVNASFSNKVAILMFGSGLACDIHPL